MTIRLAKTVAVATLYLVVQVAALRVVAGALVDGSFWLR